MIFQPNGGAGGGGGLTVYTGTLLSQNAVTFEPPVKLVFVTNRDNYNDIPLWSIILRGENKKIYDLLDTWPPEELGDVSLSDDGKTLSLGTSRRQFLYYAIG